MDLIANSLACKQLWLYNLSKNHFISPARIDSLTALCIIYRKEESAVYDVYEVLAHNFRTLQYVAIRFGINVSSTTIEFLLNIFESNMRQLKELVLIGVTFESLQLKRAVDLIRICPKLRKFQFSAFVLPENMILSEKNELDEFNELHVMRKVLDDEIVNASDLEPQYHFDYDYDKPFRLTSVLGSVLPLKALINNQYKTHSFTLTKKLSKRKR